MTSTKLCRTCGKVPPLHSREAHPGFCDSWCQGKFVLKSVVDAGLYNPRTNTWTLPDIAAFRKQA